MKQIDPISIRFSADERKYLEKMAKAQGHGKVSKVVRRLVRRELHG